MKFYEITSSFPKLGEIYPRGLLADGELVRHLGPEKKAQYMVFDLLWSGERVFSTELLADRLPLIGQVVVAPYRLALQQNAIPPYQHPLAIIGKLFFDKMMIGSVFR